MKKKKILLAGLMIFLAGCQTPAATSSVSSVPQGSFSIPADAVWSDFADAIVAEEIDDPNPYADGETPHYVEQGTALAEQSGHLNFFEINDTHGALDSTNDVTGMDHVSTLMNSLAERDGEYIGILGGDIFQGGWLSNQTRGAAFVDIINRMNFNCFVIGNHEFDWGLGEIAKFKDGDPSNGELEIPFLGANIYYAGTDTHPGWIDPFTIVNSNGYKVGIIGIIGESQYNSISTDKRMNYEFKNTNQLVESYAADLRSEYNCDFVVIAAHDYTTTTNSVFANFTGESRIDAIFCAHTHESIEDVLISSDDRAVPVIQSYTKNLNAGTVCFTFENDRCNAEIRHHIPSEYDADPEILSALETYADTIREGEETIGSTGSDFTKKTLGEAATKHMAEYYGTAGAIVNVQGVRGTVPSGDITRSKILEIFPFDNRILIVELKGSIAARLLQNSSFYISLNDDYKITAEATCYLAIIDFVYTSASYSQYFTNSKFYDTGDLIRDDFIRAVQEYY